MVLGNSDSDPPSLSAPGQPQEASPQRSSGQAAGAGAGPSSDAGAPSSSSTQEQELPQQEEAAPAQAQQAKSQVPEIKPVRISGVAPLAPVVVNSAAAPYNGMWILEPPTRCAPCACMPSFLCFGCEVCSVPAA